MQKNRCQEAPEVTAQCRLNACIGENIGEQQGLDRVDYRAARTGIDADEGPHQARPEGDPHTQAR